MGIGGGREVRDYWDSAFFVYVCLLVALCGRRFWCGGGVSKRRSITVNYGVPHKVDFVTRR